MSSANGTLGEIIKALDISGVEMIALGLPENRIIDVSRRLATNWQCSKYEIVGHVLSTNAGKVHARYIDTDSTGANLRGGARIEVTLERIDRPDSVQRFRPHYLRDGSEEFLLLLAEAAAPADHEREETLSRIVEAADFATFELSVESARIIVTAPLTRRLGLPEDAEIAAADWQALIHPDDAQTDPIHQMLAGHVPQASTIVRMRETEGAWLSVEFIVQVVRRDDSIVKLIGLARALPARAPPLDAPAAPAPQPEERQPFRIRDCTLPHRPGDQRDGTVERDTCRAWTWRRSGRFHSCAGRSGKPHRGRKLSGVRSSPHGCRTGRMSEARVLRPGQ
jgi:PAS domain-containing protein